MAGTQQKMTPLMLVALLVAMGLTFYMMFAYEGPFRWASELQLKWFGSYYEKVSFLVTFLLVYGAIMLAAKPLEALLRPEGAAAGEAGGGAGDALGGLIVVVVGLGFAGVGLWKMNQARHAGALTPVGAELFETGKAPPSMWVKVKGYAVNQAAVTFEDSHSKKKFIPIISSGQAARDHGVRLFLQVNGDITVAGSNGEYGEYEGVLFHNDLPGALRVAMQRDGALKGDDYYVLDWGETPEKQLRLGRILAIIGGGVAGVGVIVAAVMWLRRKPAEAAAVPA
jgi:hypothetical protein